MSSNNNVTSRKRCRGLVGVVSLAVLWCQPANAFVNPIGWNRVNTISSSPLSMSSSPPKPQSDLLTIAPPRLSAEKQRELLLQTVELRRLKKLETDLAIPTKATPLLSVRCREAGYGEDLEAYEMAITGGETARETLITTNMGLVHYCVNDIIGTKKSSRRALNSLSREDLVQEGVIGLARAVDRWNPAIGGKFSTYAVYWVRAAILRCIAEKDDLLRVPEHVSTTVRQMTRAAQKLGMELDSDNILSTVYASDASWREALAAKALAEEAGLTDKQLEQAMSIRNRRKAGGYVAFESWMQKGQDIESDVSTLGSREEPLRAVEREDLKKVLGKYLRPKEMEALFWRYGLLEEGETGSTAAKSTSKKQAKDYVAQMEEELYGKKSSKKISQVRPNSIPEKGRWGEAMSFKEVGRNMEISAEYGRRLCQGALKKLRQAADDGLLEPALLF